MMIKIQTLMDVQQVKMLLMIIVLLLYLLCGVMFLKNSKSARVARDMMLPNVTKQCNEAVCSVLNQLFICNEPSIMYAT
jgi:hypothetical protein